jgi:hypothetical protein
VFFTRRWEPVALALSGAQTPKGTPVEQLTSTRLDTSIDVMPEKTVPKSNEGTVFSWQLFWYIAVTWKAAVIVAALPQTWAPSNAIGVSNRTMRERGRRISRSSS